MRNGRPYAILGTVLALLAPAAPSIGGAPPPPPAEGGQWGAPFEGQVPAVNMALLADGRVLYWSGVEADESDADPTHMVFLTSSPLVGRTRVVDLSTAPPTITTPANETGAAADLFCSGQTILPDGRVLTAGATRWKTLPDPGTPLVGGPDARAFDPDTNAWTRVADMNLGRWYPTVLKLPNGSALAATGIGTLNSPAEHQVELETYDAVADDWTVLSGADRLLPLYARLFVVPGGPAKGELFYPTTGTLWGPFGEHPLEALWSLQQSYDFDSNAWRFLGPSVLGARQHANSVMLPVNSSHGYAPRILTFGGTLQRTVVATPLAELADLSTDPPTNELAAPLHHARWHANGVVLPDGKVLVVGGGQIDNVVLHGQPNPPVLVAEIYDAAADAWTEAAAMEVPRMYHSTAVLLPDGSVLAGGHVPLPVPWKIVRDHVPGEGQVKETRLEVYKPPYFFWGTRPGIEAAPANVAYNATFTVQVSNLTALHSVVLVHPGATTHAYDMAQRSVELDVVAASGSNITVRSPPDAIVAPPGHYMLFVNGQHANGPLPSVARFLRLG